MTRSLGSISRMQVAGLTAGLALVLAACSGSAATATPSAAPASVAAPSASSSTYEIRIAQHATLGAYLTGEDGKSLYLLTKDSSDTSTCSGACAAAWPPFELEASEHVTADAGVTGTLATIKRADDGKMQVTYNGIPLYYFANDAKAGDTNGQGVKGVWFLVGPASAVVGGQIAGGVGQGAAASSLPGAASPSPAAPGASAASMSVQIASFAFGPPSLSVGAGSTVTWTNGDSVSHTVTADDGSFSSGPLAQGAVFSHTFAQAGTYAYHCRIHSSMTATIVVTASSRY